MLCRSEREKFSDCTLHPGEDMAQGKGSTTCPLIRDLQFFAGASLEVKRAWRALREAQRDLFLEASRRGKDYYTFGKWLQKEFRPLAEGMERLVTVARLHCEGAGVYGEGIPDEVEIEIDDRVIAGWRKPVVEALEGLTDKYRTLMIPNTLRGRTRGRRVEGESLLRSYEALYGRARVFLRKHPYPVGRPGRVQSMMLLDAFLDVRVDDLPLMEQRKPGQFALAVLARWESLSPHTVRKHVIAARKIAGRARPKSRIC